MRIREPRLRSNNIALDDFGVL